MGTKLVVLGLVSFYVIFTGGRILASKIFVAYNYLHGTRRVFLSNLTFAIHDIAEMSPILARIEVCFKD